MVQPDVGLGQETLYAIIGAVARGPDLDRILPAVVDLLVRATSCHACFVYLREDDTLRMRAASPIFADAVGKVEMSIDEGLSGWVVRHREPAFIRDNAFSDPRMKYFPELDEQRFQSIVAVPLISHEDEVIGTVVLHTEAPREFGQEVLDFLVHVASLVAGAIDNARLYDRTQRQIAALSGLTALSETFASLTGRSALYSAASAGVRRLLDADACHVVLLDERGAPLQVSSDPDAAERADDLLVHAPGTGRIVARLLEHGIAFGVLVVVRGAAFASAEVQLAEACANQLAVALRKAELIERLTSENLVRDVFAALEQGDVAAAATRAAAAGWDNTVTHVIVDAGPVAGSWDARAGAQLETRLRFSAPSALCDIGLSGFRALAPLASGNELAPLERRLDTTARDLGLVVGLSRPRRGFDEARRGIDEATDARTISAALDRDGGARSFARLGVYRYLAPLVGRSGGPDPVHTEAVVRLAEYDARRGTQLLDTLEQFLADRGNVSASAAALVIHPNTLRQRLQRIDEISGLELEHDDLLSLELALKLQRLYAR